MQLKKVPDRHPKKRITKKIGITIIAIAMIVSFIGIMNWLTEGEGVWKPDYPEVELGSIVGKQKLTEADYQTLFYQTGLGRAAVDELIRKHKGADREKTFETYQDHFFASGDYESRPIAVIVHEERIRDEEGNTVRGFEIPDLRNGDILITKATYSLGWRHGHAAIITDAAKGETMEAILLGYPSMLQNISKWRTYPSLIHLRLKEAENADPAKIAEYAKKEVLGVPYGLFTGIPVKAPEEIKKTQCSHLVWYPYARFGYDLDSDGSWLVTPKDIANSDLLEVVQVFGVNPKEIWQ